VAALGTKLREPGLALEEARSDLGCSKCSTPERACSCYIGVAILASDMVAKGTNPLARECDIWHIGGNIGVLEGLFRSPRLPIQVPKAPIQVLQKRMD